MRALITGSCGFVGSYLVRHLLECGDEVLATYFASPPGFKCDSARHPRSAKVTEQLLDVSRLNDTALVIGNYKPEVIYHLAAISFVPEAEEDFGRALLINVAGTANVFRSCYLHQIGVKIVCISSAEVYGKIAPSELPITERSALRPANNYSLTKAMAELVAERYVRDGDLQAVIARPFNHIGPGQSAKFVASSFAYQLARIAKGEAPALLRVGNLDVRRDFSDVRDIVRAYRLAALRGTGVYNLCSAAPIAIRRMLEILIDISGVRPKIEQEETRVRRAEVPEVYGSYARAEADLGWRPEVSLQQSLGEIYRYWYERV